MHASPFANILAIIIAAAMVGAMFVGCYVLVRGFFTRRQQAQIAEADYQARSRAVWERSGGELFQSPCDDQIIAINPHTQEVILGSFAQPRYYPFSAIRNSGIEKSTEVKGSGSSLQWGDSRYSTNHETFKEVVDALFLSVTVDDWQNPVYRICFFQSGILSHDVARAAHDIERVQAHLQAAMRVQPASASSSSATAAPEYSAPVQQPAAIPVKREFNHTIHIILSVLTGGFWVPVWIILYLSRQKYAYQ